MRPSKLSPESAYSAPPPEFLAFHRDLGQCCWHRQSSGIFISGALSTAELQAADFPPPILILHIFQDCRGILEMTFGPQMVPIHLSGVFVTQPMYHRATTALGLLHG